MRIGLNTAKKAFGIIFKSEKVNERYISLLINFVMWAYVFTVVLYISAAVYFFIIALSNLLVLYGVGIGIFILGVGILLVRRYKHIKKYIEYIRVKK